MKTTTTAQQANPAHLISAAADGYAAALLALEHLDYSTEAGRKAYLALDAFVKKAEGQA